MQLNALFYLIIVESGGITVTPESLTKQNSGPCKWVEEPVKLLLRHLEKHKEEVNKLAKTRSREIKKTLWNGASAMLLKRGYKYSPKQCWTKWKNIKKLHKVKLSFYFLKKCKVIQFLI